MSPNSDEQSQSLGLGRPSDEIDQISFRLGSTTGPNFKGCFAPYLAQPREGQVFYLVNVTQGFVLSL